MPKFAANLTMLFTDVPFLERFGAAARAGFKSVEFLHPYDYTIGQVREALDQNGLQVVLFNVPSGNWAAGDRGIGADPTRVAEYRAGVKEAVTWVKALGSPRLNCLAGKAVPGHTREEHWKTLVDNIRYTADALAEVDVKLMVEFINHYDIPGFVLNTTAQTVNLLAEVDRPNVYIQYDVYHAQREEGNLLATVRDQLARIGHIQIADCPGRHQPGTGEINYPFVFSELDRLGYTGFVSLEYIPAPDTLGSLGWIKAFGYEPA